MADKSREKSKSGSSPQSDKCPYKLDDSIEKLPFIGPKYSQKLQNLEIETVKDIIYHFPHRYKDTRDISDIDEVIEKGEGTVLANIDSIKNIRTRSGRWLTKAQVSDHSGTISAVWFNQPYLSKSLKVNQAYLLDGKINTKWGGPSMMNPQYEQAQTEYDEDDLNTTHLGKLTPRYPETAGVSSKWLRARIKSLREFIPQLIDDFIPKKLRKQHDIISLHQALENIHFPEEIEDIQAAQKRLGLDELIKIQIKIRKLNKKRSKHDAPQIPPDKETIKKLHDSLGYTLTSAQKKAVKEIFEDLDSNEPMYRLLNGDVGSGKTIVALSGALAVTKAGYSAVIMAPTTILANQHYQNIKNTFENAKIEIPVKLFTSNQKEEIDTSKPQLVIGTHALIYQNSLPSNIALLVVDEEHRFGVKQRQELKNLASEVNPSQNSSSARVLMPHYLTMTATPIPRSLTLALYGETNVSTLDELPPGRKPTKTFLVPQNKRSDSYKWIREKLQEGEQIFVICPLVEESDKVDAKSALEEYKRLKEEVFPDQDVSLVHGQMKEDEKDQVLKEFEDKKTAILVATPVVEVGIDIPNATIMIIENAERFGLAQLHQFRGRIGRGDKQGYCFLFTDSDKEDVQKRLKFFSETTSGFKVAQYDLKRRGPGEVYGTQQSGMLQLRFADLSDNRMIKTAGKIADELIGK